MPALPLRQLANFAPRLALVRRDADAEVSAMPKSVEPSAGRERCGDGAPVVRGGVDAGGEMRHMCVLPPCRWFYVPLSDRPIQVTHRHDCGNDGTNQECRTQFHFE